jgi:hypothetical protein
VQHQIGNLKNTPASQWDIAAGTGHHSALQIDFAQIDATLVAAKAAVAAYPDVTVLHYEDVCSGVAVVADLERSIAQIEPLRKAHARATREIRGG